MVSPNHFPQNMHTKKLDEFYTAVGKSINVFKEIRCTDIPTLANKIIKNKQRNSSTSKGKDMLQK